jgi:hypothetical protein
MQRSALSRPPAIIAILLLQVVPLIMFPGSVFAPTSQQWWLPLLLVIMVLVADFQIIVRRTTSLAPWYLIAFAQGFNIISRLMMVWANATVTSGAETTPNWPYVILTLLSITLSVLLLSYTEKPEVRSGLLPA